MKKEEYLMRRAAIEGRIGELERQISQERKKLTALNEVYSRSHFKEEDGKMVELTLHLNADVAECIGCRDGRKTYRGRLSVRRGAADPVSGKFMPALLDKNGKFVHYLHCDSWSEIEVKVIGE